MTDLAFMSGEATLFGRERWTATELGEALCLSTQRINQLVKEGVLPAAIDGRYLPRDAVSAYVRHLRQREAGKSQAGEAVRKMQLENEMRRIKLRRIAGELVPVDRVQKDWFEITRRVRDGLLNLPSRLSGVFAAELSQENIFELFTREIHQVLTELSSRPGVSQAPTSLPLDDPADSKVSEQASVDDTDNPDEQAFERAFLEKAEQDPEAELPEDRFSTGD